MDIIKRHHSLAFGYFVDENIMKHISIEKVRITYHGTPYEMQTEMQREGRG